MDKNKVIQCIGLLNSMISCGEKHSEKSIEIINQALKELIKTEERIKIAAAKTELENGKEIIASGRDHASAYQMLVHLYNEKDIRSVAMGFLTTTDRFVDRQEAAKIAWEARQIQEELQSLISENLNYPILVCPTCETTMICSSCGTPFDKK